MRNVITTVATLDVPADYSKRVDELLGSLNGPAIMAADRDALDLLARGEVRIERLTYQETDGGQREYCTRLVTYPSPDTGKETWAVEDWDSATHEVEEGDDRAEAEARYEELVRDRDKNHDYDDEGNRERFTYTDVSGIDADTVAAS